MEMSFERSILPGYGMYMERQFFRRGKKLEAKKEDNEKATKINPYAIA